MSVNMRSGIFYLILFILPLTAASVSAGPKGTIVAQFFPAGTINVDGDFSDWPLDSFQQVSRQPLFPAARDSASTDAFGDHIIFEKDRVGFFNGSNASLIGNTGLADFGAANYFAYDESFLYILAVIID